MKVREVLQPDAIPSIDEPVFDDEYFGDPNDDVIVVDDSPARAYPVRILHRHEIVNDELADGMSIAVTWCPLCGSAVVYDRLVDGSALTFGVSGKLADDDLVMYDRETESEWKQSLGQAIAGDYEGAELEVLPAAMTTWDVFRREHPDGIVLQPPSDEHELGETDYEPDPYQEYVEGNGFGLAARRGDPEGRTWDRSDLNPKAVVLGVERGDDALGFPRPEVEDAGGVVRSTVEETDLVVFATDDGMHAYRYPGFALRREADDTFVGDGTIWDGATGWAADGRCLERIPTKRLCAFTWQDDHGPEAFFSI